MKNLKHTPTPWKAMYSEEMNMHWINAKQGSFNLNVANMNGGENGDTITSEEAKANAKLIASAPFLLEELQSVDSILDAFISDQKMSSEKALEKIIELRNKGIAIEKATK